MGIIGEPDTELVDLLAEVEAIEQASMKPIRAGVLGKRNLCRGRQRAAQIKAAQSHPFSGARHGTRQPEAPRLTNSGPVPYDAYDATRPLEDRHGGSVETTLQHPRRGFIKLEERWWSRRPASRSMATCPRLEPRRQIGVRILRREIGCLISASAAAGAEGSRCGVGPPRAAVFADRRNTQSRHGPGCASDVVECIGSTCGHTFMMMPHVTPHPISTMIVRVSR